MDTKRSRAKAFGFAVQGHAALSRQAPSVCHNPSPVAPTPLPISLLSYELTIQSMGAQNWATGGRAAHRRAPEHLDRESPRPDTLSCFLFVFSYLFSNLGLLELMYLRAWPFP